MSSRMEKYYQSNTRNNDRTSKNQDLYSQIYSEKEYTNVEGVITSSSPNEIDINKIKELLKSQEKKNTIIKEARVTPNLECDDPLDEEKNYDIKELLDKARDERNDKPTNYRSLKNTEYDILKGIKLDNNKNDFQSETDELKELINTITSTSLLNKLGDRELSLDLLNDLRSNTMIGDSKSIKSIIEEEKKADKEENEEVDRSFYTSSLNFKNKDFEQLKDINNSIKKNNTLIKFMLAILIIVIVTVTGLIFYNFLK
ncbi:MAG: hypothetical protein ACM3O4_02250 [Ignavibacteriales bacterium]